MKKSRFIIIALLELALLLGCSRREEGSDELDRVKAGGAMHSADTSATWVIQAWFLVYQAKFWQDPQAQALLGAVPDDHMLVLDLWGDRSPAWKARRAFYGKPWIWNVLYNFGGKVSVNGDLPKIAANLDSAIRSPEKGRLEGLGMTMEGLGTNPIVPDFVMDQVWRDSVPDVTAWTHDYVTRRYPLSQQLSQMIGTLH